MPRFWAALKSWWEATPVLRFELANAITVAGSGARLGLTDPGHHHSSPGPIEAH